MPTNLPGKKRKPLQRHVRPFLKWAGNKYNIIEPILNILGEFPSKKRLIEPFVGSGAVFLNTNYQEYYLSDANQDLITLYRVLQKEGKPFIEYCREFFTPRNNLSEQYYSQRERFNETRDKTVKAALFVYLNRHCFNGLCRYNSQGKFNVPFGKYRKPYFPEDEMVIFHQKSQRGVTFEWTDFKTALAFAGLEDIVYCDPPYDPISATANFTSYSKNAFNRKDQQELAELAGERSRQGITILISNHNTDFTRGAYHPARIKTLDVQRTISCNGANRKKASELLALFH